MHVQYEIRAHGRVQGVGFRAAARNQARRLNLTGWVENQSDGSVKIRVCGKQEMCNQFIHWCRIGSGYSWVERLDIQEMPAEVFSAFTIRY